MLFFFLLTEKIYEIYEKLLELLVEQLVVDEKQIKEVLECNLSGDSDLNCYDNSSNDALDKTEKELIKSHYSGVLRLIKIFDHK